MNFLIRGANYVSRLYFNTPPALRWVYWLFLVAYFLSPVDFVPDLIPGFLGRLDDLLLFLFAFWALDRAKRYQDFFQEARKRGQRRRGDRQRVDEPQQQQAVLAPHEVLGVPRGAGQAEIKKAYRKMLGMYHPDKFAHLGVEFEETARRRTQNIIEAYEKLRV